MALTKSIIFRIEEEDYNKLFLIAEKEEVKVSDILRFLVYKAIKSPKLQKKKPKKDQFHPVSL